MRVSPLGIALVFTNGMLLGTGLTAVLLDKPAAVVERGFTPIPLTSIERASPIIRQVTVPMTVRLRILPRWEWEQKHPEKDGIVTLAVARYYDDGHTLCTIEMPDGDMIVAWPAAATAMWGGNREAGDRIAHELLHCIRGDWHP